MHSLCEPQPRTFSALLKMIPQGSGFSSLYTHTHTHIYTYINSNVFAILPQSKNSYVSYLTYSSEAAGKTVYTDVAETLGRVQGLVDMKWKVCTTGMVGRVFKEKRGNKHSFRLSPKLKEPQRDQREFEIAILKRHSCPPQCS